MLHTPEWIPAWRLKQAYSLTEADILSLVQGLGERGHVSLHAAWGALQEYFLRPQAKAMPGYWRSALDALPVEDSPSWIVRAFRERDNLYETLRIVSIHAGDGRLQGAVTTLFQSIYEGEPSAVSVENFCIPFVVPDNQESSRLFFQIFYESLLFNKYTAVETLEKAHYPLIAEVKGITKDFVKVIHSKIQQPVGIPIEKSESVDSQDCASQHIITWTAVLPKLNGIELTAAKLAIEKWRGKSHIDAYKAALPSGCAGNPKEFVSKKKAAAERVAQTHSLIMPEWHSCHNNQPHRQGVV